MTTRALLQTGAPGIALHGLRSHHRHRQRARCPCVYQQQQPAGDLQGRDWEEASQSNSRSGQAWQPLNNAAPPPPTSIRLCGMNFTFNTARSFIATRMHSYMTGQPIQPGDLQLMMEVLQFHSAAAAKIGPGVSHMTVEMTKHDTKCFWVHRTDGTSEDFSYIKCLQSMAYMYANGMVDEDGKPNGPVPVFPAASGTSRFTAAHLLPPPNQLPTNQQGDSGYPTQQGPGYANSGGDRRGYSGQQQGRGRQQQYQQRGQQNPADDGSYSSYSSYTSTSSSDDDWFANLDQDPQQSQPQQQQEPQPATQAAGQPQTGPGPGGSPGRAANGRGAASRSASGSGSGSSQEWEELVYTDGALPQGAGAAGGRTLVEVQPYDLTWKEVLLALRAAIVPQLVVYKNTMLGNADASKQVLHCALSGDALSSSNSTVRYAPPQCLKDLALQWMRSEGIRQRNEVGAAYVEGQLGPVLLNARLAQSWKDYHGQNAQVQLVRRRTSPRTWGATPAIQQQQQ